MIRNAVLWTLEGAVNSAMTLQEELLFYAARLKAGQKLHEIEQITKAGNIIRIFELGAITITMAFQDEQDQPQITIMQQKWINTDTTLLHVRMLFSKKNYNEAIHTLIAEKSQVKITSIVIFIFDSDILKFLLHG